MEFEEFSKKRTTLEKGVKRVQFKFVLVPVLLGVAIANLFGNHTFEYMLVSAIVVSLVVGLPLHVIMSKKIDSVARELGFMCNHCQKTLPLKRLAEVATTGKCPGCGSRVIN